ncbi:MAG TPA: hypothetical protein VF607_17690 [Verrucomicrobiae bacterium]
MKNTTSQKSATSGLIIDRKQSTTRSGTKLAAHRYERRKLREQLRRLDWALPDDD